jgi:MFS transporter, CP family, cyanate transporter
MASRPVAEGREIQNTKQTSLRFGLLWLLGAQQMITLLAVPPVIPLIHRDLGLNETEVAVLTSLPILLFAFGVIPGSLLIARLGACRVVIIGLLLTAASGLRGLGPSIPALFSMTFVTGVGIAIALPAIPALVSAWFPNRIGLATATYVNGLLVGETLSASLTLPVVLPFVSGRWELCFAFWAVPVLLTALLVARLRAVLPDASGDPHARWWPDWRLRATWRLGSLQGGSAAAYLGANTFLPDFLRITGRPQLIGISLTVLNAAQLPASFVTLLLAPILVGRRSSFLAIGFAMLAGLASLLVGRTWGVVLGASVLGFFSAFMPLLTRALPPALAEGGDVHRLSAGMFAIGYVYSFVVPVVGGIVWDASRIPAALFLPVAAGTLTIIAASVGLNEAALFAKSERKPSIGDLGVRKES